MPRNRRIEKIEALIGAFLNDQIAHYRKSHLDDTYGGVYYWNEREYQWALFNYMRNRSTSYGIGSEWTFHAEGTVDRPAYSRWGSARRADIIAVDHEEFKRWWRHEIEDAPTYDTMIEVKVVWSGQGRASTIGGIQDDVNKLDACLRSRLTKSAYVVLIDSLDRSHYPYYAARDIHGLIGDTDVGVFHWPDGHDPVTDIAESEYRLY